MSGVANRAAHPPIATPAPPSSPRPSAETPWGVVRFRPDFMMQTPRYYATFEEATVAAAVLTDGEAWPENQATVVNVLATAVKARPTIDEILASALIVSPYMADEIRNDDDEFCARPTQQPATKTAYRPVKSKAPMFQVTSKIPPTKLAGSGVLSSTVGRWVYIYAEATYQLRAATVDEPTTEAVMVPAAAG